MTDDTSTTHTPPRPSAAEIRMAAGAIIRRAREASGFSFRSLGRRLKVDLRRIQELERGERWAISFEQLTVLADVLGVELPQIFGLQVHPWLRTWAATPGDLAQRLDVALGYTGLAVNELARQVGCDRSAIWMEANGKRATNIRRWLDVDEVLGLPSGALLLLTPDQVVRLMVPK